MCVRAGRAERQQQIVGQRPRRRGRRRPLNGGIMEKPAAAWAGRAPLASARLRKQTAWDRLLAALAAQAAGACCDREGRLCP